MKQPQNIHKESGFRLDTKNLIVSALEKELAKSEINFKSSPFQVKRVEGVKSYSEIPDIVKNDSQGSYVYLVQTKDVTGMGLSREDYANVRKWFEDFDSVLAITQSTFDGGNVATGICQVKVYGDYIGAFEAEK